MGLTPRQLNRATLARQMLLGREAVGVVDGIRRIVAVQAQQPASPYIALWNRLAAFDPADLDAAFADHTVVKATLMRTTLHAVDADDHPVFREAMLGTLRAAGLNDRRFTSTGLTKADADELVRHLLDLASRPCVAADVEAMLTERLGSPPEPGLWRALRCIAPLVHAPTGGPWSFGTRPSFLAAPTGPAPGDRAACQRRLVRRYLEGFGPASARDIAQFVLWRRSTVHEVLVPMADTLTRYEAADGTELFDVPDTPLPAEDTPAPPRLMAMWDSSLLAYADRGRVMPAAYRQLVTRRNGDVLPTLLVDGHVCGVWRPAEGGIEALPFHPLPDEAWDGLAAEARGLWALLADRDPTVYSRYAHWWAHLPASDAQLLPG